MTGARQAWSKTRPLPVPGTPPIPRTRRVTLLGAIGVLAAAAVCFTAPGANAVGACHRFLDYYGGVFSLVALSLTVMGGLAATDRLILLIRHRVLLQAIHRATAAAAMGFLAVHIVMKIVAGHARLLDAAVPFLAHRRAGYVGLGTVAAYLMVIAAWTGIARGRFAGLSRPGLWRLLHSSAYAAWPVALLHGLASGRAAPGWVTVSYAICLVSVAMALLVRLIVHWGRQQAAGGSTTGSLPRIGTSATPVAGGMRRPADPVSPGLVTTGNLPRVHDPYTSPPSGEFARVEAPAAPQWPPVSGAPVSHRDAEDYPARHAGPLQPGRGSQPPITPAPPPPRVAPAARQARRRAADTAPPAPQTFESVSDDEFWAFMRGERP